MHPDNDDDDTPRTWGQRHGITIMTIVMAMMLLLVIIVQVGC
ncbi:MAG TPA: hypothetical protein VLB44_11010 [Kofleriaceae bacterium]|nr:hypothetical protein [Kofleriaceae bacterium]